MVPVEQRGIIECEYGQKNPMAMRCQEAPLAVARGSKAHLAFQEGMTIIQGLKPFPKEGFISEDEAMPHNFSFLQLAGVRAGEGRRKISNVSGGITWDRITELEDAAQKIILGVGGKDVIDTRRYGYKFVAFVKTDAPPEEFYERFINIPTQAWKEELLENIADVQRRIQNRRRADFETRHWFLDTFYGLNDEKPLRTAFEKDGKKLFRWDSWASGEDMWETNDPDGMPYSLMSLALNENTDENTRQMLFDMMNFLKGPSDKNRFWIEFNYGPDAVCCDASSVSQANFYKTKDFIEASFELGLNQVRIFSDLAVHVDDICSKCKKSKNASQGEICSCKEEVST